MKDLPNVYANPIDKEINNVQKEFLGKCEERASDKINLLQKINMIFSSKNHIYKSRVRITTKTGSFEKMIVGKSGGYLLTLDGEKIKIIDIYDIEKI